MSTLSGQFLLDPSVTFLNHGSFGATPKPVFESYQRWQRRLELQPVKLIQRDHDALMAAARSDLADFIGAAADDVVFVTNPTTAVNVVVRSLDLQPGDEIVTTDHEYGAMDRTWKLVCSKAGATYIRTPIPLPMTTAQDFVERVWASVTARTKVLFLSHMTSATAITFPVTELCRRARAAGILSIIDGAHVPGHLPLDVPGVGADVYTGACHKWMCAPKGSSFLWATHAVQQWILPLVVSWGWESASPSGSQFVDYLQWQGTRDPAAYLATTAAIEFMAEHDWPAVQDAGHELVRQARQRIGELTGLAPVCPDSQEWFGQMATIALPELDEAKLKARLYDEHSIELPINRWGGRPLLRVSCTAYNTEADIDALVAALVAELPRMLG